MSLHDDLVAAKALIDTPEKFAAMGKSHSAAIYEATQNWRGYVEADQALSQHRVRGFGHASIMDTFDRAIAAASVSP